MKKRLGWFTQEEVQSVADDLGVSTQEVLRMEQRLNAMDTAFDAEPDDDEATYYRSPARYLEDHSQDPALLVEAQNATAANSQGLFDALSQLDERSVDIVKSRWLSDKKATLHDLAARYSVSAERIRQLEQNAMKKVKAFMQVN